MVENESWKKGGVTGMNHAGKLEETIANDSEKADCRSEFKTAESGKYGSSVRLCEKVSRQRRSKQVLTGLAESDKVVDIDSARTLTKHSDRKLTQ
jgi:hypothetical protein